MKQDALFWLYCGLLFGFCLYGGYGMGYQVGKNYAERIEQVHKWLLFRQCDDRPSPAEGATFCGQAAWANREIDRLVKTGYDDPVAVAAVRAESDEGCAWERQHPRRD